MCAAKRVLAAHLPRRADHSKPASVKLASVKLASLKLASLKLASLKLASLRLASLRLASVKPASLTRDSLQSANPPDSSSFQFPLPRSVLLCR